MSLSKSQIKILRKLRKKSITRSKLLKHLSSSDIESWVSTGLITCNEERSRDSDGFSTGELSPAALYTITSEGLSIVEEHDWFDMQYVLTYIIVPIIIGVASSVISTFLLRLIP